MSDYPLIQYLLQSASHPAERGQTHVLITAHYQVDMSAPPRTSKQSWVFATSGPLSSESVSRLSAAWAEAQEEGVARSLSTLGSEPKPQVLEALKVAKQPLSVQLKQLSQQLFQFEEPETTMELELDMNQIVEPPMEPLGVSEELEDPARRPDVSSTHLVICLAQDSRHSPPPPQDLSPLESVTLFLEDETPLIWPWVSWAHSVGAQLILNEAGASQQLCELIRLSARVTGRERVSVRPATQGQLHALVSLNAPVTGKLRQPLGGLRVPLCPPNRRLAWLLSVEPKHTGGAPRELLEVDVRGERHVISDFPISLEGFESHQPGVSFAHQLAHRGRVLELVISAYLNSELRRVVHGLDQWLKLSVSLEEPALTEWIHELKVKFLHLGRFEPQDFKRVIRYALHTPYQLSAEGLWEPTPLLAGR